MVTRDGGIPLTWHAYPGDRPDVTQFATMIGQLRGQYAGGLRGVRGHTGRGHDSGLRRRAGLRGQLRPPGQDRPALRRIGARLRLPGPDRPARLGGRAVVDQERFGRLTAQDTRRQVYGAERRAILAYSPELHQSQARGFDGTTLAKAGKKLDELAATLARGKTPGPAKKRKPRSPRSSASPGCGGW